MLVPVVVLERAHLVVALARQAVRQVDVPAAALVVPVAVAVAVTPVAQVVVAPVAAVAVTPVAQVAAGALVDAGRLREPSDAAVASHAAASRASSGVKSSTTCRRRPSVAFRFRAATVRLCVSRVVLR